MPIAPELAANAGRSNLTTFHPGDWVYVAHSGLPLGRLHRAEVIKAINASVHFDPPILDLLEDPTDPDLGELMLPQPVGSASVHNCFHECGGEAGIRLEESQRDGALWRRLIWQHPDGSTTTREVPPVKIRWQSLDEAGLGEFLAEVAG